MAKCESCGTELIAINISEIEEGWCNKCANIAIEKLHPIEEDVEVRNISDEDLIRLSTMTKPSPQWMTHYLNNSGRR